MLSVIVCTRDRADRLEHCLASFEAADAPPGRWQLLVVDNDSGDHTSQVVEDAARRGKLPLQYAIERARGLSFARNHGLALTTGSIIAFTDDDCLVTKTWLTAILHEFDSDGALQVLGGRVEPATAEDAGTGARLFADRLTISSFDQIMERLIGCNMILRRSVFDSVGLFDTRLGAGTCAGSAEDLDMFYRALHAGVKMCFSPEVVIRHGHGRTSEASLLAIRDNYGRGRGAFYCKHILQGDRLMGQQLRREVVWLIEAAAGRQPTASGFRPWRGLRNLGIGALQRLTGR